MHACVHAVITLTAYPFPPQTFEWESGGHHLSHQQLPLLLSMLLLFIYARDRHYLQKAVIDLGKSEMAATCTFVTVSRLCRLEDGLFQLAHTLSATAGHYQEDN